MAELRLKIVQINVQPLKHIQQLCVAFDTKTVPTTVDTEPHCCGSIISKYLHNTCGCYIGADNVGWAVDEWLWRPDSTHSQADSSSDARRQTSPDGCLQCHAALGRCPPNGRQYIYSL